MDGLDDSVGNFRTFKSLEGIVTADMRHRDERHKGNHTSPWTKRKKQQKAAAETRKSNSAAQPAPLALTVVSKGRTLIIDTDLARAVECGEYLRKKGMSCTLCVASGYDGAAASPWSGSLPMMRVKTVSVSGCFGGFTAMVGAENGPVKLKNQLSQDQEEGSFFDLVLDLQRVPAYAGTQLPVGYYAPGEDAAHLDGVLTEMTKMRGRFSRPQFTVFLENRCFHGGSGSQGCLRCQRICPVGAIHSEGRGIVIDPYICQGCGGCALVCPAAAIRLSHPLQEELLSELRHLIVDSTAKDALPPTLILYDRQIDNNALPAMAESATVNRIYYGLEEIGRVGLEVLMSVLAYGAGSVILVCDPSRPAAIREALRWQVRLGEEILMGLGLSADRVRFLLHPMAQSGAESTALTDALPAVQPVDPLIPSAIFAPEHDKPTLVRMAAMHLYEASGAMQPVIALPEDAPFGAVAIEAKACSLCMACAGSCPSGALTASGEEPRLTLVEIRCHQCGLCVDACPEKAVRLLPRLLCDMKAADSPTVLREAEPLGCIECGEPFASLAMISRMQEKLTGHWMYNSDRQMRRLRMCRTCRTRDALMAKDFQS
ncbi:MAG: 4Fe-4S binding protein [Deltaproteobacteria bacterium]